MKYVSTRGAAPVVDFAEAMVGGLAPDGGLYVPESWPALPPWTPLIDAFEKAVLASGLRRRSPKPGDVPSETVDHSWTTVGPSTLPAAAIQSAETMVGITSKMMLGPTLGWTDETRALELDDAVRRSLAYHRAYTLDLQHVDEPVLGDEQLLPDARPGAGGAVEPRLSRRFYSSQHVEGFAFVSAGRRHRRRGNADGRGGGQSLPALCRWWERRA